MGTGLEVSVDTNVERRRDWSQYQVTRDGDVEILISKELVRNATDVQVDVGRFLFFFRNLRAEAELYNGLRLGRGGLIPR